MRSCLRSAVLALFGLGGVVSAATGQDLPVPFYDPTPAESSAEELPQPASSAPTTSSAFGPARGGTGGGFGSAPSGGGGPLGGGPPGYDATWYPTQSVVGQAAELGFVRQGLSLGAPLWRGDRDMVMASLGVRNTLFTTDAVLPDSGRPFPHELWNVTFGLNYLHQFDNGWTSGLMTGLGSASDQPFHSLDEMTANLGGFLRVPSRNGRDSWQFMLMYMVGGPVNFPLPMVSYAWNPSDQLRINLGLPFSVVWQPTDDWLLNLSYMPLNNVNARLTYRFTPELQAFGGYEFLNESYFLTDRVDDQDRYFVMEQRLITGWRWTPLPQWSVEAVTGYSFGRYYGEGDSQWGSLTDRVDVDAGPFVGLNLRLQF